MQDVIVIVIGGSFAGLSGALQLGRASVPVTAVDGGAPRYRTSPAAHGAPCWDGTAPDEILSRFRAGAGAYPSPTFVDGTVVGVTGQQDDFTVTLAAGDRLEGRRIVLAHGVRDTLPDVPGVVELWGRSVLHCPYGHGFEVRGRPLAVLANHPMSGHQIQLLRAGWTDDVTALTGLPGGCAPDDVSSAGHWVDPRPIERLSAAADGLKVTFAGGDSATFAAAFAAPAVSLTGSPADRLGCTCDEGPLGPFVRVGPMGQTSVPGVFAAGDCARPDHTVTSAIGDGAAASIACHQSLVFPNMLQHIEATP